MDNVGDYSGTYVVIGPPGAGKTTFLARQVHAIAERYSSPTQKLLRPNPVLVCSMTRAAASEAAARKLPIAKEMVGTVHAHAWRALCKPMIATSTHAAAWNEEHPHWASRPSERDDPFAGNSEFEEMWVLRNRMEPASSWPPHLMELCEAWEAFKRRHAIVDFCDIVERAIERCPTAPGDPAVVLADEAQDMSALEWELVQRWGAAAGAMFVVGDPSQAIYTWRGSHPELFDDSRIPRDRVKVLSRSYRVPRNVQAVARRWLTRSLPWFDHEPRDADGWAGTINATHKSPSAIVDLAVENSAAGRTTMIVAPCSHLLADTLGELRRRGVAYSNPWAKHRGEWNPVNPGRGYAGKVADLIRPLLPDQSWWTNRQAANAATMLSSKRRDQPVSFYEALAEQAPADEAPRLLSLADEVSLGEACEAQDWPTLSEKIHDLLTASESVKASYVLRCLAAGGPAAIMDEPRIFIGTAHSFKGAEADNVVFFPDLSRAGWREWRENQDSVIRMVYVAVTRAKERLFVARPSGPMHVPLHEDL